MPGLTPSSPPNASATVRGLVSTLAQTFAGPKTFLARIVATLGITSGAARLDLRSDLGANAADVCSVVGSTVADGSVNAGAKLISARTGLGGTEVEYLFFTKAGALAIPAGVAGSWALDFAGGQFFVRTSGVAVAQFLNSGGFRSGYTIDINPLFGAFITLQLNSDGRVNQRGTDSGAAPGAATANNAAGINAIASGATSVTITNSLVAANSRVMVTWHADHGAARWWVTRAAGSFTVTLSAAATANAAFSWEVSSLL